MAARGIADLNAWLRTYEPGSASARRRLRPSRDLDIEMKEVLARSQLCVDGDGRLVAVIGLDVDHPGAAARGDLAQLRDEGRREPLPTIRSGDHEVVDVDLAPRLLKFLELVGYKSAQHLRAGKRDKRHDVLLLEQGLEIGILRRRRRVGVGIIEG